MFGGMGLNITLIMQRIRRGGGVAAPVSAIYMGQSEIEYLFNTTGFYRQITQPTPGNGNLIVFTQDASGAAPVRTVVNATTVAAGQVNPAMAAGSALLAYARPGRTFVVGDGAVAGTSRFDLADDTTNGTDGRLWTDFTSVVAAVEAETGRDVDALIEGWYNADSATIATFRETHWPLYFGANGDGTAFTLGGTVNSRIVDHCLYDASAAPTVKGRGAFKRAATKWHMLTPMPFFGAPVFPTAESANFSENGGRLGEPDRATIDALAGNSLATSVSLATGPSMHITKFGGASTEIHPDVANKDGQVLLAWPFFLALLRQSGMTIGEPSLYGIEGPSDGSYADLVFNLPNGGNLTTLAALRSTSYGGTSPHRQAVVGVEISRSGGARRPVYATAETSYPAAHRGTVTITDTGSGSPRRGRVRITPTNAFIFGDAASYLRGQGTAALQLPRDFDLYPWMLIEHVPSLYDATALYPFEGVAVKPYQTDIAIPVAPPAFAAQAANFDGGDYYSSNAISVGATSNFLFSMWLRCADTTWNTPTRRIYQFRIGSTIVMELLTASSGRMTMRFNNDTATDTATFYAAAGSTAFITGQYYHIMAAGTASGCTIYVNGVSMATLTYASLDFGGQTLTQIGVGAGSTGTGQWNGDIGHLYINLQQTLDLSVLANREKFALAGVPVNLGADGSTPTGSVPDYYYDGAAPAWNNKGTRGNVTLTGALTASSPSPSY